MSFVNNPGDREEIKLETLFLVPTERERECLPEHTLPAGTAMATCGFGPILSAAQTGQLLRTHQPSRVVLLGIAGTYTAELEIGSAYLFERVACFGIGAGQGGDYEPASQLGWATTPTDVTPAGVFQLDAPSPFNLLTVCSAAANGQEVAQRQEHHPGYHAEDMEGFAVATACHLARVPLTIIRGISNRAGDRERDRWAIDPALQAAWELANMHLGNDLE